MDQPFNGMSARDLPSAGWHRSRRSSPNGNCVELAVLPGRRAAVRDSKDPEGPVLIFSRDAVAGFVHGVRAGSFRQLVP
jgi:hypothetical protein